MKRAFLTLLTALTALTAWAIWNEPPAPVSAQVSRPHATATPQGDRGRGLSVPVMPTPITGCAAGAHYLFADDVGCIYACSGVQRNLLSAGAVTCTIPTGAPTATPTVTATATVTPTPTPTLTPTPTPTST